MPIVSLNHPHSPLASRAVFILLVACAVLLACTPGETPERVRIEGEREQIGTVIRIELFAPDRRAGEAAMEAAFEEIRRVEFLISEWHETSETSAINRAAGGQPVTVGPETFEIVLQALEFASRTGGAFDPTFAACGDLYRVRERRIPSREEIDLCLQRVGYRKIVTDPTTSTVHLPLPGMQIGLGGLRKGYAIDRAAQVLKRAGIEDFMINGGGDIRVSTSEGGSPWSVTIAHPREKDRDFGTLLLERGAVVTSGDYQWYFEEDGIRYHHIIDPQTGLPAGRSVAVTVLAPTVMEADAMATGLFVIGPGEGTALVESLPGVEALFIGSGMEVSRSPGFPRYEGSVP